MRETRARQWPHRIEAKTHRRHRDLDARGVRARPRGEANGRSRWIRPRELRHRHSVTWARHLPDFDRPRSRWPVPLTRIAKAGCLTRPCRPSAARLLPALVATDRPPQSSPPRPRPPVWTRHFPARLSGSSSPGEPRGWMSAWPGRGCTPPAVSIVSTGILGALHVDLRQPSCSSTPTGKTSHQACWQAPAALQFPRKCLAGRAIRKRAQGRQGRYNQRLAQAAQGSGLRPHRAALMRRLARVRHSACPHRRIRSHALWLCAIGRPLPGQSLTAAAPGSADLAARGCRTGSEPDRHPPRGRPTGAEVLPRRPPGG